MKPLSETLVKPQEIVKTLKQNLWFWVAPIAVCTMAALAYALLTPQYWEARQAFLLRDEAGGDIKRHGRFDNLDAMKTAQNTVLEIVRNPAVVADALTEIGPPEGRTADQWPTPREIERCRKRITLKPPTGAEFGSTEVLYLSVQAATQARAVKLADVVFRQLTSRLQVLRDHKARTMIAELDKTVRLAQADLDAAATELQALEAEVGPDLAELRNLNDTALGSNLRNTLVVIENELRQVHDARQASLQLQEQLRTAKQDPDQFVAMPNSLLESQPALRRLKDGLVDAQLRTATLLGNMREQHPEVRAALDAESEVRRHLHRELEVSVRGLAAELAMNDTRIRTLNRRRSDLNSTLDRLSRVRVEYDNLEEEVRRRGNIVDMAQKDLANARATLAAAETASLVTQIEQPEIGQEPVGPGVITIILAGLLGGAATGIGLVFLVAPGQHGIGRRWTDRLWGRRSTDSSASDSQGRRANHPAPATDHGQSSEKTAQVRALPPQPDPNPGRRAADAATRHVEGARTVDQKTQAEQKVPTADPASVTVPRLAPSTDADSMDRLQPTGS